MIIFIEPVGEIFNQFFDVVGKGDLIELGQRNVLDLATIWVVVQLSLGPHRWLMYWLDILPLRLCRLHAVVVLLPEFLLFDAISNASVTLLQDISLWLGFTCIHRDLLVSFLESHWLLLELSQHNAGAISWSLVCRQHTCWSSWDRELIWSNLRTGWNLGKHLALIQRILYCGWAMQRPKRLIDWANMIINRTRILDVEYAIFYLRIEVIVKFVANVVLLMV